MTPGHPKVTISGPSRSDNQNVFLQSDRVCPGASFEPKMKFGRVSCGSIKMVLR